MIGYGVVVLPQYFPISCPFSVFPVMTSFNLKYQFYVPFLLMLDLNIPRMFCAKISQNWFWSSRKCEKFTDGRTDRQTPDDM